MPKIDSIAASLLISLDGNFRSWSKPLSLVGS